MRQYIVKRLLLLIPVWLSISALVFVLMRVIPGDVATLMLSAGGEGSVDQESLTKLRHQLGTDRPMYEQYFDWLGHVVRLDLGESFWTSRPVVTEIAERLPVSMELAVLVLAISLAIALPIGIISAVRQDGIVDYFLRVFSITGIAVPNFYVGTLVLLVLVYYFSWTPPLVYSYPWQDLGKNLQQVIFPVLVQGYSHVAIISRITRSSLLEVLREDYVRTARAKGLRGQQVVLVHGLKNAMLPVVTIAGTQFGGLMGGIVIMETIFVLPGMGTNLVGAINHRDYPLVQAVVLLMATVFVMFNLVVDIMYAWLDPRIRYS